MEDASLRLEQKRFVVSKESSSFMRAFRDRLPTIQKQIPQVKGFGFFGSRIIGKERADGSNPSDLDAIVFYDGSEFNLDESNFTIVDNDGKLLPDAGERVKKLAQERQEVDNARTHTHLQIKEKAFALMHELGLPVDIDDESGKNKTVFTVDISKPATDNSLALLVMYVDANTNKTTGEVRPGGINDVTFPIVSRFVLGVGDGLYDNRKYVLDVLEDMESQGLGGEKYFRGLMTCLAGLERGRDGLPKVQSLPQTIKDARAYFRT